MTATTRSALPQLSSCVISLVLVLLAGSPVTGTSPTYEPRHDPGKIQELVDDLKGRLPIPDDVRVVIVPANSLLVSVEVLKEPKRGFLLSLEDGFLDKLSEDELKAVIAHELGHIWIFTHHPYLQTEQLANQIAMRLVNRESLVAVYTKVWARTGTKGDLVRFLGLDAGQSSQSSPVHVSTEGVDR